MADVRCDCINGPLVAIERERKRLLFFKPEVFVEPALEVGGFGVQTIRERIVARLGREVGSGNVGRVRVPLRFAQCDRRLRKLAIREANGVPGVLPALVDEARVA